jgi:hypothetical protein
MDEYIKRADALEAIRKWCGDCGSAIEAVLSVPAARGWEPDGVTNLLRDVVRGAKPGTPFVQEYAIDLQDQQLDTDVACDFVAAEMGVYVKTVLEENHQLFSVRRDERIPDLAYIRCAVSLQPGGQEDADNNDGHGKWVPMYRSGVKVERGYVSTCCDMWAERKSPYCPRCGARMDGRG